MIYVFFDGKCGLCRREIRYYQRIAPQETFVWDDITRNDSYFSQLAIPLSEGLKNLHVLDNNKEMHIGVDAFIVIWSQLKYWRFAAKLVALPGIHGLVQWLYACFAKWRFKRLTYCQPDKQPPEK